LVKAHSAAYQQQISKLGQAPRLTVLCTAFTDLSLIAHKASYSCQASIRFPPKKYWNQGAPAVLGRNATNWPGCAGYHAWRSRLPSDRAQTDVSLLKSIWTVHASLRDTRGAPRFHLGLLLIL
jgi:hypothetical protein